jgi:TFIIF-interacting CTD phosphatase-like protein
MNEEGTGMWLRQTEHKWDVIDRKYLIKFASNMSAFHKYYGFRNDQNSQTRCKWNTVIHNMYIVRIIYVNIFM